jgi:hypothetical protein
MAFWSTAYLILYWGTTLISDERQVDCNGLLHRGSGTAVSAAIAVGFGGNLLAALGPVVWTIGVVDMGQPFSALTHQVGAAASEVTGRTHLRGIDIGLGEHAPTEEHRNLVRIDLVVFWLCRRGWLS